MKIICKGKRCPVRNQCANYEKNLTDVEEGILTSKCTNQKSFIKKEE